MEQTQHETHETPQAPQVPLPPRIPKKTIMIGVGVAVLVLGVAAFALLKPDKKTADNASQTVAEETCEPRNTATCGPDGKPIGGSSSSEIKELSTVSVQKIQLTGAGPQGLDVDPETGYVYIGNNGNIISGCEGDTTKLGQTNTPAPVKEGSTTMSIVDPATGKELKRVDSESGIIWTEVDNSRNVVYAAGSGNGMVGIHQLGTGQKIGSINVGGKPHAFGLKGSVLIVSNTNDSSQTYMSSVNVDTKKVIKHQKAPEFPHGIAYDKAKDVYYMVGVKTGEVAIVDATTGEVKETFQGTTNQNGNSNMLAWSEKTRRLFISDTQTQSSVTVVDVDKREVVGTLRFTQTSAPAWGMEVDEESGLLYVALPNADSVGIANVDTLKPVGLVKVDTCPYAVRLDTKRGLAITANQVNATVSTFKLDDVEKSLR